MRIKLLEKGYTFFCSCYIGDTDLIAENEYRYVAKNIEEARAVRELLSVLSDNMKSLRIIAREKMQDWDKYGNPDLCRKLYLNLIRVFDTYPILKEISPYGDTYEAYSMMWAERIFDSLDLSHFKMYYVSSDCYGYEINKL